MSLLRSRERFAASSVSGSGRPRAVDVRRLVRPLGWLSVALGALEIVAPRTVARLAGVRARPGWSRLLGVREVASGLGIFASRQPSSWLWARLGGDVMDLAALGAGLTSPRARTGRIAAALAAVAGVVMLDFIAARRAPRRGEWRATRRARLVPVGDAWEA